MSLSGSIYTRAVIKSEEERFVLGEVYFQLEEDTQGDFMTGDEVRKLAHKFLMYGLTDKIDRSHDREVSGNLVCESFIVRGKDDPDGFREGAWVLGAYILNDNDWERVKSGEFNGWSWSGRAEDELVRVVADQPVRMVGETEPFPAVADKSEQHSHSVDVSFDSQGNLIPTWTGPGPDGHRHIINKTTATQSEADHSHRLVME